MAFGFELDTTKMEDLAPYLFVKWQTSVDTTVPIPPLAEMAVECLLLHPEALAAAGEECLAHSVLEPFMEVLTIGDYDKMPSRGGREEDASKVSNTLRGLRLCFVKKENQTSRNEFLNRILNFLGDGDPQG